MPTTPKNERTSTTVAAIAGQVLASCASAPPFAFLYFRVDWGDGRLEFRPLHISVAHIEVLAGSCLTQAPDKPKKKGKRNA